MDNVVRFPRHARASSPTGSLKPNTEGATSFPEAARASRIRKKFSGGISPRDRQLLTAGAPTFASEAAAAVPPKASMTASTELSIPFHSSRNVKMSSVHASALESSIPVMAKWGMAEPAKSLAKRMEETREAIGLSQAELCKAIGIKANRWSQYESGERRITLPVAHKLCDEFGLTLDWIYRANPAGLPHALRIKIRQRA